MKAPPDYDMQRAKALARTPLRIQPAPPLKGALEEQPDPLPPATHDTVLLDAGAHRLIVIGRGVFTVSSPGTKGKKQYAAVEVLGPSMLACNGHPHVTTSAALRCYKRKK